MARELIFVGDGESVQGGRSPKKKAEEQKNIKKDGSTYFVNEYDDYRMLAEVMAARLMRTVAPADVGDFIADVNFCKVDGKLKVASTDVQMADSFKDRFKFEPKLLGVKKVSSLSRKDKKKLITEAEQLSNTQKRQLLNHIFMRWIIGDPDGHVGNLGFTDQGNVVMFDFDHAFRSMLKHKSHIKYQGEQRRIKKGKMSEGLKAAPQHFYDFIEFIKNNIEDAHDVLQVLKKNFGEDYKQINAIVDAVFAEYEESSTAGDGKRKSTYIDFLRRLGLLDRRVSKLVNKKEVQSSISEGSDSIRALIKKNLAEGMKRNLDQLDKFVEHELREQGYDLSHKGNVVSSEYINPLLVHDNLDDLPDAIIEEDNDDSYDSKGYVETTDSYMQESPRVNTIKCKMFVEHQSNPPAVTFSDRTVFVPNKPHALGIVECYNKVVDESTSSKPEARLRISAESAIKNKFASSINGLSGEVHREVKEDVVTTQLELNISIKFDKDGNLVGDESEVIKGIKIFIDAAYSLEQKYRGRNIYKNAIDELKNGANAIQFGRSSQHTLVTALENLSSDVGYTDFVHAYRGPNLTAGPPTRG